MKNCVPKLSVFILTLWLVSRVQGHEGHQPLPTSGVEVNTATGYLTLSAQARRLIGLQTAEVAVGNVETSLFAYAESISPWNSKAFGSSRLSGRIVRLLARPGDAVAKGQIVATLQSRELENLRLEYLQAVQDYALNRKLVDLIKPSARAGGVPFQRVAEAENALQQSETQLEMVRLRATTLGVTAQELERSSDGDLYHAIRSPIAGKIVHSDLAEGKYVEAFEHLYELVNNDKTWIRIQLLEKDIARVSVGQNVIVSFAELGVNVETQVERLDVALEPTTQVSWAWLSTENPEILPGLVGSARIQVSQATNRLSVPLNAVYSDGLQNYVFVEQAATSVSSEFRKRILSLGKQTHYSPQTSQRSVEILSGEVYPGDRVVVRGGHELSSLFFLNVLKLSETDRNRIGIRMSAASNHPIAKTLTVPATVKVPQEFRSIVSSQLPGSIVSHELVPGQAIKKGDLLLEVASPEFHALQLDLLKTNLDATLSRSRSEKMSASTTEAVSAKIRLETLADAERFESRAKNILRQLASFGLNTVEIDAMVKDKKVMELLPIRANMDGYLVRWSGGLGKTIAANEELAEIQNINSVWIEGLVSAQDAPRLAEKTQGTAFLLSNQNVEFPVIVSRLGPMMDEATRTRKVYLTPTRPVFNEALRENMQLSIHLHIGKGDLALAIPKEAVLRDGIHTFVFVQMDFGYVDRRRISIGRSDGQFVEVRDGIKAGERVIVGGARELQTAYASLR